MSKSRDCMLCHDCVWFGAYGTSKNHVEFNEHYLVCTECIEELNKLPVIKEEVD